MGLPKDHSKRVRATVMDRWLQISIDEQIDPGWFLEGSLTSIGSVPIEGVDPLIEELAFRLMLRYESQPVPHLLSLENVPLESPERTRAFYRRLILPDGTHTPYFETWASETLASWIEETFEATQCVDSGKPHASDPAYDIITLISVDGSFLLRLVQVKCTENNLGPNCNTALAKFKLIESGHYLSELKAQLTLLKDLGRLPTTVVPRDLLYDSAFWYRVTALHGEDRNLVQIMTTCQERIPGEVSRRSARLIRIVNWSGFWSALSGKVHAHLN